MNWLAQAAGAMSDDSARRQKIMTLGELRAALKMLPPETPITVNGHVPASLASYRGFYERLAIGTRRHRDDCETRVNRYAAHPDYDPDPAVADVTIAEPVTAAEMVRALDLADGLDFGGYKGGVYEMHAGTWMHVAESGDCGQAVYGVHVDGETAIIVAGEYEW